jgi:hypothetical protein
VPVIIGRERPQFLLIVMVIYLLPYLPIKMDRGEPPYIPIIMTREGPIYLSLIMAREIPQWLRIIIVV